MNKRFIILIGFCLAGVLVTGCVNTVAGRKQAAVPFIKDRIEALYQRPVPQVWAAAKDVLTYNGQLESEDLVKSTFEAKIDTRTVWVKVEPVDEKVTKVTVEVRTKGGGTDIEMAGEVDKQIAIRLATGNLTPATYPTNPPSVPANTGQPNP